MGFDDLVDSAEESADKKKLEEAKGELDIDNVEELEDLSDRVKSLESLVVSIDNDLEVAEGKLELVEMALKDIKGED